MTCVRHCKETILPGGEHLWGLVINGVKENQEIQSPKKINTKCMVQ